MEDNTKEITPPSAEQMMQIAQDPTALIAFMREEEEKELKRAYVVEKTKSTYAIASYLCKIHSIVTVGEKVSEYYVYRNGKYIDAENEIIYPEIQRILGEYTTKQAKTETLHKIADMTRKPRSIFESSPTNLIPLKNGVYDFEAKVLLPHSPNYYFTYQFPITYDKQATCPKTEAFLDQILTPEQRETVEEWIGYYFYRLYAFKKAIIFVGEGDTGKTTLLEVITNLLGRDNLSAISLQKLANDRFSPAHMHQKHGNIVDELSDKDITDTGHFKIATGNGSITAEHKYGNQFSFVNYSKLTFACNRIPDASKNDDDAYYRRWLVIRFQKTIEKKIPNFIATLTTEEERSGLFNLAITALERLLTQGEFSNTQDVEEIKLEMMRSGSSIAKFASDMLEEKIGEELSKEALYDAYTQYCKDEDVSAETMKMFGTRLPQYIKFISDGRITDIRGKQQRGWRNARLKGTDNTEEYDAI